MKTPNLSAQIADFEFENCLMNASGAHCMSAQELKDLIHSESGSWVSKSSTLAHRKGNPEPRYVEVQLGSINSMGLPNQGHKFYLKFIEENGPIKPGFLSVAGLTLDENLNILNRLQQSEARFLIELNLSCPNIPGKPQTAYDFDRTKEVLNEVFKVYHNPLGVKLPPYFDMVHFEQMADILNQFPLAFVTCINSIGNGLLVDIESESVLIKPKGGFGGIGGEYVKPTALANVHKFRQLLKPEIAVIGCGGVIDGADVFEHILCGADMVQVGTQLMKEGPKVFERLKKELQSIMIKKNYTNLAEFRNKLKA